MVVGVHGTDRGFETDGCWFSVCAAAGVNRSAWLGASHAQDSGIMERHMLARDL